MDNQISYRHGLWMAIVPIICLIIFSQSVEIGAFMLFVWIVLLIDSYDAPEDNKSDLFK